MERQKSSAMWRKVIVMAAVLVALYGVGNNVAFAQAPDDGADSLTTFTSNSVIDLSTNDGGGDTTGNNSGGGSGNQNNESGENGNNNRGNNNNPPPCVPPPHGLFGGVANIISVVLNPCG